MLLGGVEVSCGRGTLVQLQGLVGRGGLVVVDGLVVGQARVLLHHGRLRTRDS